jgi:phosphoribosyl-AMP cyclohydrolase
VTAHSGVPEQPTGTVNVTERPASDEPASDEPASDEPASDEPAPKESASEETRRARSPIDLTIAADFSRGSEGLLPAIAQDADSDRVLMMAWMNEEAFRETLSTGQAVYYSRSRQALWRKGETSGHRQTVREIRVDCDRDTILLRVSQVGAACHQGFESCFYRRVDCEDATLQTVDERLVDPRSVYGR